LVFVKRLVSSQWKRAFAGDCCDASFVKPLTAADLKRVEQLLRANSRLEAEFDAYPFRAPDLIVNLSMGVLRPSRLRSFCKSVLRPQLCKGLNHDGVLRLLEQAELGQFIGAMPTTATLQLICRNHEVDGAEFIFRDCQVMHF
jgi:hypothetical protein